MKKIISIFLAVFLIAIIFGGCSNNTTKDKTKIVTTYFAAFNWAKNILGERYSDTELILISDNGMDMHSYQPTADDVINIKTADIVIYNGTSVDQWVGDTLKTDKSDNIIVINSLEVLKDQVLCVGEAEHNHTDHHHDDTVDEHMWLSLKNAVIVCQEIEKALCKFDAENSDTYTKNAKDYKAKLNELSSKYQDLFSKSDNKTLIFADRFPFRYTLTDYSLNYTALFEGCTSESDATVDAILSLSKKIDQENAKYVFIIDTTATKTAKSVIDNSKSKSAEILMLDSMQTVTKDSLKKADYIKIMQNNLSLISKAIS